MTGAKSVSSDHNSYLYSPGCGPPQLNSHWYNFGHCECLWAQVAVGVAVAVGVVVGVRPAHEDQLER